LLLDVQTYLQSYYLPQTPEGALNGIVYLILN